MLAGGDTTVDQVSQTDQRCRRSLTRSEVQEIPDQIGTWDRTGTNMHAMILRTHEGSPSRPTRDPSPDAADVTTDAHKSLTDLGHARGC